ncbi:hypothetical protein IEQ34_024694 [Dendrobium chrysotoxum]|uniref:NAD(P)H dehydrogenase subunit H n=16 Tax=Dendrobium TaxID=37818 RepID=A0AAV7FRT3_DENCH|nr:hypothetical protein IEQ34_024694 [Dendrobium chrysotoxum]
MVKNSFISVITQEEKEENSGSVEFQVFHFTKAITVNAPERLESVQVPKRASYIRVLMLELSRIASHLLWLGPFMADIGAQTPFFSIFREREFIYDLFEAATGMRMMHNSFRIGGVAADLPYGWIDKCFDFCDSFFTEVVEYQKLITRNPIFLERVEGVGIIGGEETRNWGYQDQCYELLESNGIFVKLIAMSVTRNLIGKSNGKKKAIH